MEFFFRRQLLSPLLICTLFVVSDSTLSKHRIRHHRDRFKRQQEANLHLPGTYVTSDGEGPDAGPWGDWFTPSHCSRTCGGGVSTQYRQCHPGYRCNGPSRRHFSCNTQGCPDLADFRAQQCSEYDRVPFEGIHYQWIPYTKAPNSCELNCMPRGERFYYRHKDSVIDGTLCNDEKLDVCVEGICQPVGCDTMLGSSEAEDKCRQCGGDGSMCNTIAGDLDMQDLIVGYNDILLIPNGATNIFIEEVTVSNNYLAVRNTNSQFYLNGNWSIDFPRTLEFAGSKFHYGRSTRGFLAQDSLRCLGPTNEPLIIVLLFQNNNIGIQYEYSIPKGIRPGGETETYAWLFDDFTPCSRTCGGGVQYRNVTCAGRKTLEPVDRNLCDSNNEPAPIQSCDEQPCEPQWTAQGWEECSVACGDGIQKRKVYCQQIIKDDYASVVVGEKCAHLEKPETKRPCNQNLTCPEWHIEPWKPCDHICGIGVQTRKVTCFRKTDGRIDVVNDQECIKQKPKPSIEKKCYLRSCEGVDWITSKWSGCENKCGLTYETREVICASQKNVMLSKKLCDSKPMPELVRQCVPNQLTCYMWYASEWSECSTKCGNGVQTRTVFCGNSFSGGITTVEDKLCDPTKRYETRKTCTVKKEFCPGVWFTGPWSTCSKECGGGQRARQIVCLKNEIASPPSDCDMNTIIFSNEDCNSQPCDKDQMFTTYSAMLSDVTLPEDYSRPTPSIAERPTKENRSIDYEYEEVYDETCEDGEWVDDVENKVSSDTKNEQLNDSPFVDDELMLGDEPIVDDDSADKSDSDDSLVNDENGSGDGQSAIDDNNLGGDSAMEGSGDLSDSSSKLPESSKTRGSAPSELTTAPSSKTTVENIPQVGETDIGAEEEEEEENQPLATLSSPITDATEVSQTSTERSTDSTDTAASEDDSVTTELQSSVSTSSDETELTGVTDSTITVDTSTEVSSSEISQLTSEIESSSETPGGSESSFGSTSESEASTESKSTDSITEGTAESSGTESSISSESTVSDTEMSSTSTDALSTSETVSSSEGETDETSDTLSTSISSDISTESSSSVETQSTATAETASSVTEVTSGSSETSLISDTSSVFTSVSSLSSESEMTSETRSEGTSVSASSESTISSITESSSLTSSSIPSSEESTTIGDTSSISTDTSTESSSEKTESVTVGDTSTSSESTSELTTSSQLSTSEQTEPTVITDTSESTSGETGLTTVSEFLSSIISSLASSESSSESAISGETKSTTIGEISSSLGSSLASSESSSELPSTITSLDSSKSTESTVISSETPTGAGTESTIGEISSSLGSSLATSESSSELPSITSSLISSESTESTVISSKSPTSVETASTVSEISSSLGSSSASELTSTISSLISSESTESTIISSESPISVETASTVSEISSSLGSSSVSELTSTISSLISSESTESTIISSESPISVETASTVSEISSSLGSSSASELTSTISSLISSESTESTIISSESPTSVETASTVSEISSSLGSSLASELTSTVSSLVSSESTESTLISSELPTSAETAESIGVSKISASTVSSLASSERSSEYTSSSILPTSAETESITVGETSPSSISSLASSESTGSPTSAEAESTTVSGTSLSTISSLAISESSSELSTSSSGETSSVISDTKSSSISTISGTEISSTSTVESSSQITSSSIEFTTESTETTSIGTEVTSESQSSIEQLTEISASSESSGSTEFSSSTPYTSRSELWAITPESTMSTEFSSPTIWGSTSLAEIFTTKKLRKCRKKKRKDCKKTQYGCCVDKITPAKGPFNKGCPVITTCKDTPFGCCEDEVSVAMGKNFEGCPAINCTVTLFGCCLDNKTVSQGNDYEGCPLPPPKCIQSLYGCCNDNVTEAKGSNKEGCTEEETTISYTESSVSTEAATSTHISSISSTEISSVGTEISSASSASSEITSTTESTSTPFITFTTEETTVSTEIHIHCSQTPYGCCPDNITAATGPNYKGCKLPCEDNQFGCCENGATPAHGPNREGCCLITPHGCCPDNIRPAQGPNLEGCGCEYSPYRCCPDNATSARGYYNEGCGCQYTTYGCCPDKRAVASGPNFYGCHCNTFQFGCCPDGVTIARGSYHQGCDCRHAEFGCCSDERTPATGPNVAGCDCASSKYGCCLDGEFEAQGDNFEGCRDVPVKLQASCGLKKENGPCKNYTVKWYFDTEYGGCSRFWYGGCKGNDNRFKSKEECEDVCVKPTGTDMCSLPKITGACEGYYPMWYYDNEQNTCAQFVYSGCLGNNNKFETKEDCAKLCVRDISADPCEQSREEGPCRANYIRWYYDKDTGNCDRFIYGGCKANSNNFLTESACKQQCAQLGRKRNYCSLPKVEGNCAKQEARWYFESSEDRCMPFYYTGCDGNNNNFLSQEYCEASCPKEIVKDTCLLPAEVGECGIYTDRWYYDTREQRCRQFYYGGCGGNGNNFETEKDCQDHCRPSIITTSAITESPTPKSIEPFRPEFCFLENDVGPCRDYDARWYYDRTDGACKQFMYGGCPGNGNNFLTDAECEEKCGDVQDLCGLPAVVGPCKSLYQRWSYSPTTDSCEIFYYGGCLGNKNRFDDKQSCERRCKKFHPTTQQTEITPPTIPTPTPTTTISDVSRCHVRVDAGNCSDSIPSYYYDPNSQRCLAFVYTGCGGNANRYFSEEQCERQCGKFKGQDVCRLPRDPGPCRGYFRKFYYDSIYGSCGQFVYGGCEGNGNRFSSQEECEYVCVTYEEKKPHIINETASVICRLPLDVGACREGYHKHFYFDDSRGECVPFIYSGCGGNFNNFKSFQACVDYCREFMAPTEPVMVGPHEPSKEEHPCQHDLDQCGTLLCEYGPEAFVDEETLCTKCRCYDPCRDIDCGVDYQCAVDINRNRTAYEDPTFIAVCRQTNKDGDCPQFKSDENRCEKECGNDADCALDLKCCSTGCGSVCVAPIPQIPAKFVTLSTPLAAYTKPSVQVGYYPPRIDEKRFEPEVNAGEGDYATLDCSVQGNPTPSITWKKGNLLIDGNQPRYRLLLDGALQIITLHKTDSGLYLCAADNGIGHPIEHTIKLEVTDSLPHPTFIVEDNENSIVAALGAPTTLHCYATGYPFPAVTWWKDDSMVPLHSSQFIVHKDYSLHINSVQLSNLGIYTCQAYNGIGKAASWSVTVQALGPVYSTRHEDVKYMQYVINPPERPTTSTTQRPTIVLTRPPKPVPQPHIPSTTQTDPAPVVPEVATEGHVVYQVPVKVNVTQTQTGYTTGKDISLGCDVEGYPIPHVTWYKNGQPIYPAESIQISESHRLHITAARVADSGEYQCEAVNPYSRSVSSINIVVKEPYIHPKCTDSPYFANCELIVKAQYCEHKYYARFCCKSCTEAGQLPPIGPHLRIE